MQRMARSLAAAVVVLGMVACMPKSNILTGPCANAPLSRTIDGSFTYLELGDIDAAKAGTTCFRVKRLPSQICELGFIVPFELATSAYNKLPLAAKMRVSVQRDNRSPFLDCTLVFSKLYHNLPFGLPVNPADPLAKLLAHKARPVFFSIGMKTWHCMQQVDVPEMWYEMNGITVTSSQWRPAPCFGPDFGKDLVFLPSQDYQYQVLVTVLEPCPPGDASTVRLVIKSFRPTTDEPPTS
jgi:hypothetical protein